MSSPSTPTPWVPWVAAGRSRPIEVTLAVAGQTLAIPHGVGRTPDGFFVVWSDGPVYAGVATAYPWDETLAFLRPANANTHAIVIFYVLSEAPYVP